MGGIGINAHYAELVGVPLYGGGDQYHVSTPLLRPRRDVLLTEVLAVSYTLQFPKLVADSLRLDLRYDGWTRRY
jgi:hypothetical protein